MIIAWRALIALLIMLNLATLYGSVVKLACMGGVESTTRLQTVLLKIARLKMPSGGLLMNDFRRYLLFVFETFYPSGGMEDFITDDDDFNILIEIAKSICIEENYYRGIIQIYDTEYMKIIFTGIINDQTLSSRSDYENIKVVFDERDGMGKSA